MFDALHSSRYAIASLDIAVFETERAYKDLTPEYVRSSGRSHACFYRSGYTAVEHIETRRWGQMRPMIY